jgi:hypothetical protein
MRARGRAPRAAVLAVALLTLTSAVGLPAVERITLSVAELRGVGWRAGQLSLVLRLEDPVALRLDVGALELPSPLDVYRSASFECSAPGFVAPRVHCDAARLRLHRESGAALELVARIELDVASGAFRLHARDQPLLGGLASLTLDSAPGRSRLAAQLVDLDAAALVGFATLLAGPVPVTVNAGTVSGELDARRTGKVTRLRATLGVRGLEFSDASGLRAGEGVAMRLGFSANADGGHAQWRLDAGLAAGTVYLHPVLVQVGAGALTLSAAGQAHDGAVVEVESFTAEHPGVATLKGAARLSLGDGPGLQELRLELAPAPVAALYRHYLKAFAGAGSLADLSLAGSVSGNLQWNSDGPAEARLSVHSLDLGDAAGRFVLLGLDGEGHWTRGMPPRASRMSWRAAQVYALGLGAGELRLEFEDRAARLLEPLVVPLLDGRLRLDRLQASGLGSEEPRVEADLSLDPVSLERLSERMAWLPLSGSIGGRIPKLVYAGRRLAVNGDVTMDLFDGRVTLSGLALEHPFGVVPVLRADVAVERIDLDVLTRAFSFGSIQGRLEGRVDGLVLEAWQPVAFDAVLATPADDDLPHRISQRAVDNLASLGGAQAVLSSTFLRMFSEFSYDRLGLACRLRAGVCEMAGVEDAERGYFIVKGGGLPPRVDVVGYNRRVDWPTLVQRLRAVAASRGPVVR